MGSNIEVHSLPLDGRIVLLPADVDAHAGDANDAERDAEAPAVRPAAANMGRNGQPPRRR